MNIRTFLGAAALALSSLTAHAIDTTPVQVTGPSFSQVILGSFTLTAESNVTGGLGFSPYVMVFPGFQIPLPTVSFSDIAAYSPGLDVYAMGTLSGFAFSFSNLAAGTYFLKTSGTVNGSNFVASHFQSINVAPVPEPATYGMVLLGLLAVAAVRRRKL